MTNLTDTQAILLSAAACRDDGSVYPLPATITANATAIAKSVTSLLGKTLIEERAADGIAAMWREQDDQRIGVFITDAGHTAIGIESAGDAGHEAPPLASLPEPVVPVVNKTAKVIALLGNADGATMDELIAATGWLPHTARAAPTGLRKKGFAIERSKRNDATCYRIVAAA